MNLGELRDFVRSQLEVDAEELPDAILNSYFGEAWDRTINVENQWPFYESTWSVTKAADADTFALPTTAQSQNVISLVETDSYPLTQIAHTLAEANFSTNITSGRTPGYYSLWADTIYLWPTGDTTERTYTLRGYRKPTDWIGSGADASAEPDCDARLHRVLAHYAIALAYAQQEDEVLEALYMKRWSENLQVLAKAILEPPHNRPLVLNGGLIGGAQYPTVNWVLP